MRLSTIAVTLALALASFTSLQSSHATPALTFTGGVSGGGQSDRTLGWQFSVTTPINVLALGVWDENDDGLNTQHPVGIWTDAGALITSFTIPAGTGSTLDNHFRMENIPSTPLSIGTYRIGAYYPVTTAGDDGYIAGFATPTTIPQISYLGRAFANSGGFVFPDGTNTTNLAGNFGPTFSTEAVAVVVPLPSSASAGLVGLTLLASASFLRKRFAAA